MSFSMKYPEFIILSIPIILSSYYQFFYYNLILGKFICINKAYFITGLPMVTDLGRLETDFRMLKYDI